MGNRMGPPGRTVTPAETALGAPLPVMTIVALLTAVSLELVRSTGPLLQIVFDVGVVAAAGTAAATYLGAAVLGLALIGVTRRADRPTVLLVGVILLATVRLVVQGATATTRFAVGLVAISFSIAMLTIAVAVLAGRDRGGRAVATAVAMGAALSMGLQLALGTWDAYWRHDPLGWSVTVLVLMSLVGAAEVARRDPATTPTRQVRRVWVLGPALSLMVMVMANSGFVASQSGVRLAIAGPVVAVGLLLAGIAASITGHHLVAQRSPSARTTAVVIAVVPAAAITGVFWATGPLVLVFVVVAQFAAFIVIAETLDRGATKGSRTDPGLSLGAASASLVGLGAIVPLLVFQLDYDIPLGFPNELVIVAAAIVFGAATVQRGHATSRVAPSADELPSRRLIGRSTLPLLVGAGVMVLLGSALAIARDLSTDPQPDVVATTGQLTLVSWNLHYGVDPNGGVDLEQIARSIEEQNPSIVALQEVSRGWVLGGGTDMATWLAQRLDMRVAYAPAADRQFGNAILTNLPSTSITAIDLPYGNGPQARSAISVDIDVPSGLFRVTSVHLQNKGHIATRLDQIETLLKAQADAPVLIIAGDFNAQPGSPEIEAMMGADLLSAQDVSGDPSALTDPSVNPEKRIDWVFGRGVSFANTEVLAEALSSDHLPLVVHFSTP